MRDVIEPALSPSEIRICDRLSGFLPTLMSELVQMPMTLCHGDYHSGNLLWDELAEPSTVWAVDWQVPVIGPAILDVSVLLGTSVTRDNLKLVRQEYLPEYHDALMTTRGKLTKETVLQIALEVGLDVERLTADMESPEVEAIIERNYLLAKSLGVNSTPTFVIGGRMIKGAVPVEQLRDRIAEARTE